MGDKTRCLFTGGTPSLKDCLRAASALGCVVTENAHSLVLVKHADLPGMLTCSPTRRDAPKPFLVALRRLAECQAQKRSA